MIPGGIVEVVCHCLLASSARTLEKHCLQASSGTRENISWNYRSQFRSTSRTSAAYWPPCPRLSSACFPEKTSTWRCRRGDVARRPARVTWPWRRRGTPRSGRECPRPSPFTSSATISLSGRGFFQRSIQTVTWTNCGLGTLAPATSAPGPGRTSARRRDWRAPSSRGCSCRRPRGFRPCAPSA